MINYFNKNYFKIIFMISGCILISAYVIEYFFNHPPCKLCLYQRIPYFFTIILCLISTQIYRQRLMAYLSLCCFIISFFVSGFHSLVERKIVNFDIGCTSSNNEFDNIEDLRNFLDKVPITKCDEISFSILGLSLANLNLIISLSLILFTFNFLKNYGKEI